MVFKKYPGMVKKQRKMVWGCWFPKRFPSSVVKKSNLGPEVLEHQVAGNFTQQIYR